MIPPGTEDISIVKVSISASVNWDKDYEADGVQFVIRPQDADGFLIKDKCSINARLWLQNDVDGKEKGQLIQEWSQIKVSSGDYPDHVGARVRLEYKDYVSLSQEKWNTLA